VDAGCVAIERIKTNSRVAETGCVAKERKITGGRVVAADVSVVGYNGI